MRDPLARHGYLLTLLDAALICLGGWLLRSNESALAGWILAVGGVVCLFIMPRGWMSIGATEAYDEMYRNHERLRSLIEDIDRNDIVA